MTILQDMRVAIGQDKDCTDFDDDLIFYTNSELTDKRRLGIGVKGFRINGVSETWDMYEPIYTHLHPMISMLIGLKVKMLFDGEALSGAMTETVSKQVAQMEQIIADDVDGCFE